MSRDVLSLVLRACLAFCIARIASYSCMVDTTESGSTGYWIAAGLRREKMAAAHAQVP